MKPFAASYVTSEVSASPAITPISPPREPEYETAFAQVNNLLVPAAVSPSPVSRIFSRRPRSVLRPRTSDNGVAVRVAVTDPPSPVEGARAIALQVISHGFFYLNSRSLLLIKGTTAGTSTTPRNRNRNRVYHTHAQPIALSSYFYLSSITPTPVLEEYPRSRGGAPIARIRGRLCGNGEDSW